MNKILTLLLLLAFLNNASAQDLSGATYRKIGNDQSIVYPLPENILVQHDFRMKRDDGIEISMNIYRPDTKKKVPVIIAFTSYGKDMKPVQFLTYMRGDIQRRAGGNLGDMTVSSEALWEGPDPGFWVPNGYAVITVDARGTGKSTGKKNPFSKKTARDFASVVEWASEQPWSTGKVGTTGTSYLGIIQWHVAALRPKGLVAVNVWEGLTDTMRDLAFAGGIPETSFTPWWMTGKPKDPNAEPQFGLTDYPKIPSTKDIADFEFPPVNVGNINVPVLVAGSWSCQGLHTRGTFEAYKQLKTEKFLYTHGAEEWTVSNSEASREYKKHFFDYYLKGDKSAKTKLMTVRLEVRKGDDEHYAREEKSWPLESTNYKRFHLDSYEGALSEKKLTVNSITQYAATDLNDQATFRYTFDEDTEIVGYSKLKLWVSTTHGNDMDLFVAIKKIDEDGKVKEFWNFSQLTDVATRGWLRVSLRKLDKELASDIQPVLSLDEYEPIKAREIVPVEIEILPFAVLFEKGSTLVLVIKGSDISHSANNQHMRLVNQGYHKIYSGKNYDSYLMLPITN
jgi:predicted acyl esterase